jgi:hypothetical protein
MVKPPTAGADDEQPQSLLMWLSIGVMARELFVIMVVPSQHDGRTMLE